MLRHPVIGPGAMRENPEKMRPFRRFPAFVPLFQQLSHFGHLRKPEAS
jgi:hypothetical protein